MKSIPAKATPYSKTKIFNETNIPKGLINNHKTIEGVWGRINILKGSLLYVIQTNPIETVILNPEKSGIVEPKILHCLKPIGEVKFYVEFYRVTAEMIRETYKSE